jgi:tRNA A-37 threonylcarbamoyl transferase component Bud32
MATPSQYIKEGNLFPFDAPDKWWRSSGYEAGLAPAAEDKWQYIARGIAKYLEKQARLSLSIDQRIREEIVDDIAEIINVGIRASIPVAQDATTQRADMAEKIYGEGVEKTLDKLRASIYKELGNLLLAQSKGAVVPPDITVNNVVIPLNPTC